MRTPPQTCRRRQCLRRDRGLAILFDRLTATPILPLIAAAGTSILSGGLAVIAWSRLHRVQKTPILTHLGTVTWGVGGLRAWAQTRAFA